MSNTQIQQNSVPNEPSFADLMNLLKKEILFDTNCHHLATVQSFNAANQTCTATVNYTKTFFVRNKMGLYDPVQQTYPLLVDMPVIVLGGGAGHLTFPITVGDQAIIMFNDRSIDNWLQSGQTGPVNSSRAHSFSDGIALVGLNSLNTPIDSYDTTRATLRNGSAGVGVGPTLIKIYNATTTLNTLLQSILTQLEQLATAAAAITVTGVSSGGMTSGPPANAATFTTISTQLTTLATQLGGLLE